MIFKKNNLGQYKRITISKNICYNYQKLEQYGRDCMFFNYELKKSKSKYTLKNQ